MYSCLSSFLCKRLSSVPKITVLGTSSIIMYQLWNVNSIRWWCWNSTVVITIWLTITKYQYLKWQWIFYFIRRLFFPLSLSVLLPDLTLYMSNMVYTLWTPEFTPCFLVGSVFLLFLVFCVAIQKDWQHRVHRVKKTTTQYVLDNTKQTNTNNINKTLALLQTTWG
jgi:hypothetical protein